MNHLPRHIAFLAFAFLFVTLINAEDTHKRLSHTPQGWDNVNSAICFFNDNSIYHLNSNLYCAPGRILSVKVAPNYFSFAALYAKGKARRVTLYAYSNGKIIHTFRLKANPTAIAYSANGKHLLIAADDNTISIFNISSKALVKTISISAPTHNIAVSNNGYFVAACNGDSLSIYKLENGKLRHSLRMDANINSFAFSPDNRKVAVLLDNGKLFIFLTKNFLQMDAFDGMGDSRYCLFHPESKYLSVVTSSSQIAVVNTKFHSDPLFLNSNYPGITQLGYCLSAHDRKVSLVYNNSKEFVFHPFDFTPDRERLVSEEVDKRMNAWQRQKPGESREKYLQRVNEKSRQEQRQKYENEVVTLMAGNPLSRAKVSFGRVNMERGILELGFSNMHSIFLDVPREDIADFVDPGALSFDNSLYGLGPDDNYLIVYTEATNNVSGKKYFYDKRKRVANHASDADYVPFDLFQRSSSEKDTLQKIRDEVLAEAQENNITSGHTHIDIKTSVEPSMDADGNNIFNHIVDISYYVDTAFSAQDDFRPGNYKVSDSPSAAAMLQIVAEAFGTVLKQYISQGKKVHVIVSGAADALPVSRKIPYRGEYGNAENETVTKNGSLTTISLSSKSGITSNEQLAFARALGVQDFLSHSLPELQSMQTEYDYVINVSTQCGPEYRRIGIRFIFFDAFH